MGKYVDGFLLPVPKANVEAYRHMAEVAGKVWREQGALEYIECIADDVKPGEVTSFPQSVKMRRWCSHGSCTNRVSTVIASTSRS
jgi:uncharacterized protein YbaA (DUF1428 family)